MKNVLIFLSLVGLLNSRVHGQAITIKNTNPVCSVYVNIFASEVPTNPACCIASNTIMLPPGGSVSSPNWISFAASPGFSSTCAPIPPATTTFQYTDAMFQWQCPNPPCTSWSTWGTLSDPFAISGSCYVSSTSWLGSGCTLGPSTWKNLTGTGFMDNILVTFN